MAFRSGLSGRVFISGRGNIAGIKVWRLEAVTAEIPIPHFESQVDAFGRVWPAYLKGLSGATGSLEGYFDTGPVAAGAIGAVGAVVANVVTDVMLSNGFDATLKLFLDRAANWGFAVSAFVTNFTPNVAVENQPVGFTANFRVNGVVPLSTVV